MLKPLFIKEASPNILANIIVGHSSSLPGGIWLLNPSNPINLPEVTPSLKNTRVGIDLMDNFSTKKGALAALSLVIIEKY